MYKYIKKIVCYRHTIVLVITLSVYRGMKILLCAAIFDLGIQKNLAAKF